MYFDDDCPSHDYNECDDNGKCALQAKAARFVK